MLNLDISVIIIAALVGILMLILNRLFIKPIGSVIEEREKKISDEDHQIETMTREIEEKTLHIETVLKETQKESRKIKENLITKGEAVREQMLNEARETSRNTFQTKMNQLDTQLEDAEKSLGEEIRVFSDKIKEIFIR